MEVSGQLHAPPPGKEPLVPIGQEAGFQKLNSELEKAMMPYLDDDNDDDDDDEAYKIRSS
jgi:hypothetical protein